MHEANLELLRKLQPAPRGSKSGWVQVGGQIPPDLEQKLTEIESYGHKRTDLVHQAIILLIEGVEPDPKIDWPVVATRVSPETFARLNAAATTAGMRRGPFVRELIEQAVSASSEAA